jgi:hypothetical protein
MLKATTTTERLVPAAALVAGVALAALALAGWRLPSTGSAAGARISIAALPTGTLSVSRTKSFVVAPNILPGARGVTGSFTITNVAAKPLPVRFRVRPSVRSLDRLLQVELSFRKTQVYRGTLSDLRSWTDARAELPSGGRATLTARVWLPSGVSGGYEGYGADIMLQLGAHEGG